MSLIVVTGSCGLIGSETARFFSAKGFEVVGIDNNMRRLFFGQDGSILWNKRLLLKDLKNYRHYDIDIRDRGKIDRLFAKFKKGIALVVHTAAQPSHDWAARDPFTDFSVNANGTLALLDAFRRNCPNAVFILTSTNKVYGDRPNALPLIELKKRYELPKNHRYYKGIDETMSVDFCTHSLFGVSKLAGDLLCQEYGRYFGLKTGVFRGGCLTGPAHSGAQLHGFLAYLIKCIATGRQYQIFGYKGKQVRDNIHSFDLVNMFWHFFKKPRQGEVYNAGGSRHANISVLEAIERIEDILKRKALIKYNPVNRIGDHIWYVSDVSKFKRHYPHWDFKFDIDMILKEMCGKGHF